jgi:hypothetical protein
MAVGLVSARVNGFTQPGDELLDGVGIHVPLIKRALAVVAAEFGEVGSVLGLGHCKRIVRTGWLSCDSR